MFDELFLLLKRCLHYFTRYGRKGDNIMGAVFIPRSKFPRRPFDRLPIDRPVVKLYQFPDQPFPLPLCLFSVSPTNHLTDRELTLHQYYGFQ
jgi:hypothetical protein